MANNIFDQSASAYTAGLDSQRRGMNTVQQGTGVLSMLSQPTALQGTMRQMMNPYITNVIDDAVTRLRDRKSIDLSSVKASAADAGAFGGARHGLVEAELIDRYGQEEDELVSRLLQQGYDTTANLSLNELTRRGSVGDSIVGAGGVQSNIGTSSVDAARTGLSMGQGVTGGQAAAGAEQQALIQQILGLAAGQTDEYLNYPQRSLANIMAGLSGNPLNAATTTTKTETRPIGFGQVLGGFASILGAGK